MKYLKIKYKSIIENNRLKAGFYLSDGVIYDQLIKSKPFEYLIDSQSYCSNIGGVNKRIFVSKEKGTALVSMSDMLTFEPHNSCKYVSKTIGNNTSKHIFKNEMILASVVGTIGQVAFVNKISEGSVTGNNIIKFISEREDYNGFIYAYLKSKYGNTLIKQLGGGSVQSYIDPELFKKIPVPIINDDLRKRIHQLIISSSELKVEANNLLKNAKKIIIESLPSIKDIDKINNKIYIKTVRNNYQKRLVSGSYINNGVKTIESYQKLDIEFKKLSDFKILVNRPGIFKRIKVNSKNGFPYIKGSEINLQDPFSSCEYLSKSRTPFLDELSLKENQILFTCAGTVGEVKLISKEFEEKLAVGSQDIIRIDSNDKKLNCYYLFAYLKLDFINDFIQSLKYGSVIERVEPFHLDMIPIYLPSDNLIEKVTANIQQYKSNLYQSFKLEEKAIDLIEKEIESWQKS